MVDSKSRKKARNKSAQAQATVARTSLLQVVAQSLPLLCVISTVNVASQLALHPLYGSTTTSLHFSTLSLVVCLLSSFLPRINSRATLSTMSVVSAAAPALLYRLGSHTSSRKDPVWGPIATQVVGAIPVLFLGVSLLQRQMASVSPQSLRGIPARLGLGVASWLFITRLDQVIWDKLPFGGAATSCNMFLVSSVVLALSTAVLSIRARGIKRTPPVERPTFSLSNNPAFFSSAALAIPFIVSIISQTQSPCTSPQYPYITANGTIRVLARSHSVTGMVLIAENLDVSFRFMRCDHSLLGGRWLVPSETDKTQFQLSESIYTAFILQEAVRLVERPKIERADRALAIGLGVGIAAGSFTAHGAQTTVVEIDPAVYHYAREYFDLAKPHAVFLEDARAWTRNLAAEIERESDTDVRVLKQFDYVVHDCFSGGSVPQHIFTLEFWNDLKSVMTSSGVLAVNFAGKVDSDAAHAILATLLRSFKQCRVFHDHIGDEEHLKEDFLNMVFFCTPSSKPLTFREPQSADFLSSYHRQHLLSSLSDRELPLTRILGNDSLIEDGAQGDSRWVLTDAHNSLGAWQEASAIDHWKVMRGVLSDEVWNAY